MRRTMMLAAGLMLMVTGCSNLPAVTRTGDVKDIFIRTNLEPVEQTAAAGDEVRWINKRNGPVRIVFLQPVDEAMSCNNGFSRGFMSLFRRAGTASLDPNETASVCMKEPGFYRYTVRMESATPSGEINSSGVLRIGNVGARQ